MSTAMGGRRGRMGVRWLPAAVLLVCLLLSAVLCSWSLETTAREARTAQERMTESFAQALSGRIQSYIDTLPGLRVFGVLRSTPTDLEFNRYVEAISLQRRFPGLVLTFMADLVPAASREAYVEAVRNDRTREPSGHPGFDIRPAGQRPAYMVLRHNYPPNEASFGYDIYDPAQQYRAAVDAAIEGGIYVATGPLLLARDRDVRGRPELTSVVIRAAVYRSGQTPATAAERRAAAQGVVGMSFRTVELVRSVLPPELLAHAGVRIVDPQAQAEGGNGAVYDSQWLAGKTEAAPPRPPASSPHALPPPITARIQVADRRWDIVVTPDGVPLKPERETLWLAGLGLALSASLAVMTHVLVQANARADALIREGRRQLQVERENLQRSESRYRMLFTHSKDPVMRTVPNGTVLAANPAACALFRGTEEALKAAPNQALIDHSDPRTEVLRLQRQDSGSAQGQLRLRRLDGTLFEAEVSTSTYSEAGEDGPVVSSVIVRDVSERHLLAQQQSRLAAILDATPDFVCSFDSEGRLLFLNEAGRRMLGLEPGDDIAPRRIADCHPAWAARVVLEQGIPGARRQGAWIGRTAIRPAQGSEIPMSQVIVCHRDAGGTISHYSTIGRDLTELERAESERQAMEVRLSESQKMESIGTLAGGVAHDFNNVLAAILGNAALARPAAAGDPALERHLELIQRAATRGRALVQQIMTFSRRSPPSRTSQPLQPLVEEALSLLRATLPAGVQLQATLSPEPLHAVVDASQVQQVVLNLCTNAWQALEGQAGGVHLSLERVPGPGPGRARLRVEDNGSGMDEATRLRVFEPFFTTKPVGQGTGLGLSVVHGIVTASGGTIEVRSQRGVGTCFEILLPLVDADAPAPAAEPTAAPTAQGQGEHLLYVDDDEVVALTVQAVLEHAGYRVSHMASAAQALERLRADPPACDLVVSDYNMPVMSGLELAEAMKVVAPGVPVIITSGYVTEDLRVRAQAAGVRAVLFKEYLFEQLAGAVHSALEQTTPASWGGRDRI